MPLLLVKLAKRRGEVGADPRKVKILPENGKQRTSGLSELPRGAGPRYSWHLVLGTPELECIKVPAWLETAEVHTWTLGML